TTLTIEADAELKVVGRHGKVCLITGESEICVHGKLLLSTALYFKKSAITVDGSGVIFPPTTTKGFLQMNFTLNLVGDKAEINKLYMVGGQAEMNMNLTFGPSGIDPIDTKLLELGDMATLTVDVSKYKPNSNGTSVTLFTFKEGGGTGQFATVNVTGGTGTIQYNAKDVTLSDIVVKP
ncbi:MAG: hypothetical protein ACOYM3_20955, partial [Terrimicrobiaceae bacterium]